MSAAGSDADPASDATGGTGPHRLPLGVRVVRGVVAALVWSALAIPIGGLFRWVGEALAMPPSYGPMWRGFVVLVGIVLFFAFVVDRDTTDQGVNTPP